MASFHKRRATRKQGQERPAWLLERLPKHYLTPKTQPCKLHESFAYEVNRAPNGSSNLALAPYLARRALLTLPVLVIISFGVFLMVDLFPGTQVEAMTGQEGLAPEQEAQLRHELGLDRSFMVRFIDWAADAARLELGYSRSVNSSVVDALGSRVGPTLQLGLFSLVLAVSIGVPLGVVAAARRGGVIDHIATLVAVSGVAMPSFLMALLFVLFFSVKLGWFPATGYVLVTKDPVDALKYSMLPGLTLALHLSASIMRHTRSSMLEVLSQDYIRTARAKGLGARIVLVRHALRNALLPVITVVGIQFGVLVAGQVVIEQIFAIPGVGRLFIDAISARDVVLIQGLVLMIAAGLLAINLVTDVIYGIAEPRMRSF